MPTPTKNFVIQSSVKSVTSHNEPYFQVVHKVYYGTGKEPKRVLTDCEHYPTRQEARDDIPKLNLDLKISLEKGIL